MKVNKQLINIPKILNLLVILLPLTFIFGSLFINLQLILISVFGIVLYKKDLFLINKDKILFYFSIFFFFLILTSLIDYYFNYENSSLLKSFLFLRYFIFLLVVYQMVIKEHLNFKLFFIGCLIITLFISIDIIYQFLNYKNIFGFIKTRYHSAGVFNQEAIAGGYIQRFGLFALFALSFVFYKQKKILFFSTTLILTIFISAILFSGNRMPFILILFFCFLSIILIKSIRLPTIISLFFSSLIFLSTINLNEEYKGNFESFFSNSFALFKNVKNELQIDIDTPKDYELYRDGRTTFGSGHAYVWASAIEVWKQNPLIGGGIKNFRRKCITIFNFKNSVCESHPHNYYLDILNDTGVIGLTIILLPIIYILFKNFIHFRKYKDNLIFYSIFFNLLLEFLPIRSSGSFFSTQNACFIFFTLALLCGLNKKRTQLFFKK